MIPTTRWWMEIIPFSTVSAASFTRPDDAVTAMIRSARRSAARVMGTASMIPPSTRCIPSISAGG
jgi:hypothetical protein